MRNQGIGNIISCWLILLGMPAVCVALPPEGESQSIAALKTLLHEGLVRRVPLNQVAQTVTEAKRFQPNDPLWDYAHGLVLFSRVQPAKAVERFEAALKQRPTYSPAWKALLRTRLIRKDIKPLQDEALQLAELVGSEETDWPKETERREAALWLGKVAGFLALPDVDLMKPGEQQQFESQIQGRLGLKWKPDFDAGKKALREEYQNLKQELENEISQESENQAQKAEEELAELSEKGEELDQKTETLKMTADQWKDWLDERMDKADDQLKALDKQYKTLEQAGQGVSRLVQQSQLDLLRYQTELANQGIRGRDAELQPAVIQLRQELSKYQVQFQTLEQRAARILLQGRHVLSARSAAVKKYQQATGKIVRETETLSRWKKSVEKASVKIENRDPKTLDRSLKKRLSMPASYFELDEKAELARLIEQAGGTLDNP